MQSIYAGGRADSVMPSQRTYRTYRIYRTYRTYRTYHTYRLVLPNNHRICLNMLYLGRFCSNNVVFAKKWLFSEQKKNHKEAATNGLYQTAYCI